MTSWAWGSLGKVLWNLLLSPHFPHPGHCSSSCTIQKVQKKPSKLSSSTQRPRAEIETGSCLGQESRALDSCRSCREQGLALGVPKQELGEEPGEQ